MIPESPPRAELTPESVQAARDGIDLAADVGFGRSEVPAADF